MVVDGHKYSKLVQIRKNYKGWCRMGKDFCKCGVMEIGVGGSTTCVSVELWL